MGLGAKNMSDPVLKQICNIYKTKNLTKEQKYKMTERYIFQKYDDLKRSFKYKKKKKMKR